MKLSSYLFAVVGAVLVGSVCVFLDYSINACVIVSSLVYFSMLILLSLEDVKRKLNFIWEKVK